MMYYVSVLYFLKIALKLFSLKSAKFRLKKIENFLVFSIVRI